MRGSALLPKKGGRSTSADRWSSSSSRRRWCGSPVPGSPRPYETAFRRDPSADTNRFRGSATTWSVTGITQAAEPSISVTRGTNCRNSGSTYDDHRSGETSRFETAEITLRFGTSSSVHRRETEELHCVVAHDSPPLICGYVA